MTNDLQKSADYAVTTTAETIGAVSETRSKQIYALAEKLNSMPGAEKLEISHLIHGGTYTRTSKLPAGRISCSAMLKIPTQLIVSGHCRIVSEGDVIEVDGFKVLLGVPGRQVVVYAISDTWFTCLWATKAKTVEEAELEAVGEEQIAFLKEKGK